MTEEKDDKTGVPEQTELNHSDLVENSSQPEPGGEEVHDITIDHGQMRADIGDEKVPDGLIEKKTDLTDDGDIVRTKIEAPQGTPEKSSGVRMKGISVIVGSNHKFNIQSRYLSSPIGSCHDSCKARHQHESESKVSPTSGMIRRARLTGSQSHDLSKSAPKKKFIRQVSFPGSIEEENGDELASVEKTASPSPRQTSRRKDDIQPRKKVVVRNFNLLESSSLGIKAIKTSKDKGKEPITVRAFSPKTLVKKSPSMKARLYKNTKSFFHPSKLSSSKEAKIDRKADVPEKTLYMIEPYMENKPAKRASRFSPSNENISSNSKGSRVSKINGYKSNQKGNFIIKVPEWDSVNTKEIDTMTKDGASNTPTAKSLVDGGRSKPCTPRTKSPVEGGGSKPNTPRVRSPVEGEGSEPNTPRARSTVEGGGSKPNTPTVRSPVEGGGSKPNTPRARSTVEGGGSKPSTPRSVKSNEERARSKPNYLRAKSTKGHGGSRPNSTMGDGGSKPSTPRTKSALERKMKAKGKVSGSDAKDGPAWKVKFKKGTVVALQTGDGAAKKILLKRERILGDGQMAKDEVVRILKNRRGNEACDAKQPESRRVSLRHQEAYSRKETVDLNNVIEETVSQLVKTRKSKVKALVGAFETVMSLNDHKATAETSAF